MPEASQRLTYTEIELQSYLPSGWAIRGGSSGRWDATKGAWRIEVRDPADNAWPLVVEGRQAAAHGRIDALKKSVDALYREALS